MNDTICAISTAVGIGAISIVRISGEESINIVNKIFDKDLTKIESHTINYGHIIEDGKIIDEVMVSLMRAPKTFTREDIVEINCHGGIATTNKVLELLLENGARLAEPGEFTKRAFLNGRIDLIEAESIMDLIDAKTESQRKLSINGLEGRISKLIRDIIKNLIDLNANIEVNIDYPEYEDIEIVTKDKISEISEYINKELGNLLKESENGKIIKEGINTLIIGKPNVGKSSILNKLLNEDKAIVTNIAGTTRDIVEGEINLDGIIINIIDTAGIRSTNDVVESIGVEKSLSLIKDADLVIVVLNNNEKLSKDDKEILEKTKNKERIIVINKVDLDSKINLPKDIENVVYTSTIKEEGIEELKEKIKELFNIEKIKSKDYTYLSNTRQISLAKKALKEIKQAETALNKNMPVDIIEIDLNECFNTLGEIIGETYSDEIIDNLFKNFCVGK